MYVHIPICVIRTDGFRKNLFETFPNVHAEKLCWQWNDVKRHLQDVHDHPQGPYITRLVVLLRTENLGGCGKRVLYSMIFVKPSTYQHSRVCSRVSGGCPWCGSPSQTQSQSASALPYCLQQYIIFQVERSKLGAGNLRTI